MVIISGGPDEAAVLQAVCIEVASLKRSQEVVLLPCPERSAQCLAAKCSEIIKLVKLQPGQHCQQARHGKKKAEQLAVHSHIMQ